MLEGPPPEGYGYIKISRKAYENDPFWNEPREFSRWEAWEDLIQTAAWTDHTRVVDMTPIRLERGQILASERFLSKRWGWSRGRVRRYLTLLEEMDRISVDAAHKAAHLGAIVTLCNYDTYQTGRSASGPPTDHQRTRSGPGSAQVRPKDKAGNKGKAGKELQRSPKNRARRLSDEWEPNEAHTEIANDEGVSIEREAAKFRDHAQATGRTQKDWDAAFRNWLRKAAEFKGRNGRRDDDDTPQRFDYSNATETFEGFDS